MDTLLGIQPAKRLGEVKEYYFSKKLREISEMRAAGHDVLNLGIGSPDLPPADQAIEALHLHSKEEQNHAYQSYKGIPALREAFAQWYQRWFNVKLDPNAEILPLIGSKEGLMHIAMAFLDPGDEVLVPNPGYPAYMAVSRLAGATIRFYKLEEENNWLPNLDQLDKMDLSKVKIMWVNYPNMPTGTNASLELFERLVAFAERHQLLLCNDNPYAFILNDAPKSIFQVAGAKNVALELNSLSKSHNMAGWRVGMVGGHETYLQTVLRFKSNMDSGMFKPVQLAAVQALNSPEAWYQTLNDTYRLRRKKVEELLDLLNCRYQSNQVGMFVWANIPAGFDSGFDLSDEILYQAHVFLTPGGIFGTQGTAYIRISLCSPIQVYETAIERIKKIKNGVGSTGR